MENVMEGSARSDHESDGQFRIKIAEPDLIFLSAEINDPKPTGRQIIRASGREPAEKYALLQWLASGDLEPIRLNETVDLRADGVERFIVAMSDRAFFFELQGERQEWPLAFINGRTLKRLAGKDSDEFIVILEREDEADEEIADDQMVDLSGEGLEKFAVRSIEKLVQIFVNTKSVVIERGDRTGLEIKQAAIAQGVNIQLDFVLSLEKRRGQTQIIGDTDVVKIKKGQTYVAIADDDNS